MTKAFIDPVIAARVQAFGPLPDVCDSASLQASRERVIPGAPKLADILANPRFVTTQHEITTEDGACIPVLFSYPTGVDGCLPVVFSIHGGGMVGGTFIGGMDGLMAWDAPTPFAICSPGYRLAPEHPHPVPVQDCVTALRWLISHADELGVDPDLVIVMGESAGGGLAAGTALLARDTGGPHIAGLCLVYPMLDDRNESASVQQLATDSTWSRVSNAFGWRSLLGDAAGGAGVSPYAAPARATSLQGLPRTFVECGSADLFRSEILAFAERAWLDGVDCELHVWPGGLHGYFFFAPEASITVRTLDVRREWLYRALQGQVD